ncbi:Gliding motility lipoprotein GldH [Flavobacterium sp. CECT 9288]|uniref:gliding motility lipoprotein GldH n=1 Tax=Flavobacterium sp. CECT 9288 TaxID=2845819 RepID=UPI001E3FEB88|nr:gliding motility lipoprotein GldH [Flavobacterium sp. CECT 9288]CAH0337515.1 Gliding motility lipoprotein GldH [Flavobacterium sp. CECT 9288]
MWIRNSTILFLLTVLFVSCDKKRSFDEYHSVGNAWHKDSTVTFSVPILDSTQRYNLFVNLRANNNYQFNNLFLIVAMELPNGFTKVDTLEYQMADVDGTLLGDGFSDIKESKLFYKENVRLRSKYRVHIKQAVRENGKVPGVTALNGITEVGFRIEKKE